jgi:hypothetical protein
MDRVKANPNPRDKKNVRTFQGLNEIDTRPLNASLDITNYKPDVKLAYRSNSLDGSVHFENSGQKNEKNRKIKKIALKFNNKTEKNPKIVLEKFEKDSQVISKQHGNFRQNLLHKFMKKKQEE